MAVLGLQDVIGTLVFCGLVGLVASGLSIVDALGASDDPWEALKTKEGWTLYGVNLLLAGVIAYALITTGNLSVGILPAVAIIVGYPTLLHTKLFTANDTHVGLEEAYKKLSDLLLPRINTSIRERARYYLEDFAENIPMDILVKHTRLYLQSARSGATPDDEAKLEADLILLDKVQQETSESPETRSGNAFLVYKTLLSADSAGSYRAMRKVRKGALKEASKL